MSVFCWLVFCCLLIYVLTWEPCIRIPAAPGLTVFKHLDTFYSILIYPTGKNCVNCHLLFGNIILKKTHSWLMPLQAANKVCSQIKLRLHVYCMFGLKYKLLSTQDSLSGLLILSYILKNWKMQSIFKSISRCSGCLQPIRPVRGLQDPDDLWKMQSLLLILRSAGM